MDSENKTGPRCPKCKKPMKVHNDHWVDPLLECRTPSCSNSTHKHRKSTIIKGVK